MTLTIDNLVDLLELESGEFIFKAYELVVGRPADIDGITHYVMVLRRKVPRVVVLAEMRSSPEGEAYRSAASCKKLDEITKRYKTVAGLPIGNFRWFFLPKLKARCPDDSQFDWDSWFSLTFKKNPSRGGSVHTLTVSQFMRYYDIEFIDVLYDKVLHRRPNEAEISLHLENLRRGKSRKELMYRFVNGSEAKFSGEKVEGLVGYGMFLWLSNIPLVGRFIVALYFLININSFLEEMRSFHNYVYRMSKANRNLDK